MKTEQNHNFKTRYDKARWRSMASYLLRTMATYRTLVFMALLLGIAEVAVSLLQIWAVKRVVDCTAVKTTESVFHSICILTFLIVLGFALKAFSTWIGNIAGTRAKNNMRQHILQKLLTSRNDVKLHSGDIVNRIEIDVATIINFIGYKIPNSICGLIMSIAAFVCLYLLDHFLLLVILAVIVISFIISRRYIMKMREYTKKIRTSESNIQAVIQDCIQNRPLLKALEASQTMLGRFSSAQGHLYGDMKRFTSFSILTSGIVNAGESLIYILTFLWAALRMQAGTLSFGGMTAFLQLITKMYRPIRDFAGILPALINAVTSAERLMEIVNGETEHCDNPIRMERPCGIRIDNLTFRYDQSSQDVFSNISINFRPGTSTALLGKTGTGKTTMLKMMVALAAPQKGSVNVYNEKGQYGVSPDVRCNCIYVPQGNTLIHGTIRDNLLLGNPKATDKEMMDMLRFCCADFVQSLPSGLDTLCYEKGGGLSEGQAQRIAIARGLLHGGDILILDEITTALDEETKTKLLDNLFSRYAKHTMIIATHDPKVINMCKEIVRIE